MNTTTLSRDVLLQLASNRYDETIKMYRKTRNWLNAVDEYLAGNAEYPSLRRMPSKDHKHRMYDQANTLMRLLVELGVEGMKRPMDLNEIGQILEAARVLLGKRR